MLKAIKNNLIMKTIFKNIHNKIKLKIIKYNKNMLRRLDIKIENFKIYETLKEFNEQLKLTIIDIDIKELDLTNKNIGNKELEFLKNINFKELQKLDLSDNEISDIKVLENVNFKELQTLQLSDNNISDIKVLENVNFKELQKLILFKNKITDIKILEKVKFEKLEIIELGINNISNIDIKELDLSYNEISDIKVLENVNFKEIKELDLRGNQIDYNSTIIENLNSKIEYIYY